MFKSNWLARCLIGLGIFASMSFIKAQATTVALTAAQLSTLNGAGAAYGPPGIATFPDGPFTVTSGTQVNLTGGPAAAKAQEILLVFSATPSAIASLGAGDITLSLLLTGSSTPTTWVLDASDFYTTSAAGFPTSNSGISGIANGDLNGIKFPSALHAAVEIDGPFTKNVVFGSVDIDSPIDLRVDVFGVKNGLIFGNVANSGAEGIDPATSTVPTASVPEPATWAMIILGFAGIGFLGRRRQKSAAVA